MEIKVSSIKINYKTLGKGKKIVLFLHGWGGSINSWRKIEPILKEQLNLNSYKLIFLDLPGFGNSQEPKGIWGIKEYSEFLKKFIKKINKNKKPVILIAHSFGGQIATYFAILYRDLLEKLILIDPACIRKESVKSKIINLIFKNKKFQKIKKIPFLKNLYYKFFASKDYTLASNKMKKIMKRILKEDLEDLLKTLEVKTFLIWGEKDNITPVNYGLKIKKLLKSSQIFFIKNSKHSPHIENPKACANLILKFIKNE